MSDLLPLPRRPCAEGRPAVPRRLRFAMSCRRRWPPCATTSGSPCSPAAPCCRWRRRRAGHRRPARRRDRGGDRRGATCRWSPMAARPAGCCSRSGPALGCRNGLGGSPRPWSGSGSPGPPWRRRGRPRSTSGRRDRAGARACRPAGDARGLTVRITSRTRLAGGFGALRPVVLLPESARAWPRPARGGARPRGRARGAPRWPARADRAARLRRPLVQPLVWAAARRLRCERELACDARVLAAGVDPRAYAASLVQAARAALARPAPAALIAMAHTPELERRVLTLLGAGRGRRDRVGLRTAAALAAVALFIPLAARRRPIGRTWRRAACSPPRGRCRVSMTR